MNKSVGLIVLILTAIAVAPRETVALPIPESVAQAFCKGTWVNYMEAHVRVCAYCEHLAEGAIRCDEFVCDDTGCEWIIVEKTKPQGTWKSLSVELRELQTTPVEHPTKKKP
jgi:hypothetical protein